MSSVSVGQYAEQKAAEYLQGLGYSLVEQNYRRPYCEIDLVMSKQDVVYFVEVKYRSSNHFGGGLDYIAGQKLRHMQRAAETWVVAHNWNGEYQLSAIEIGGGDFSIGDFVQDLLM